MSILYLAGPYTHDDENVRVARYHAITQVAARLIKQKRIVFSPLTMTHPIDIIMAGDGNTLGSEFWVSFDQEFLNVCADISVLQLPGWDMSSGIKREIAHFKKLNIEPTLLSPSDYGVTPDVTEFSPAFNI